MAPRASATISIARSPEELWAMVADVTRMGEWSPNCTGARWDEGAAAEVGAVFTGSNVTGGGHEYETKNRIVAFEPGREIGWETSFDGTEGWSRWTYSFEADGDGAAVTESWEPLDLERLRGRPVTEDELTQMAERWTGAMSETLAQLKAVAEGTAPVHG